MKKIIISNKQLNEAISIIPDQNDGLVDILKKTATNNGSTTIKAGDNKNINDLEKIKPGNVTVKKDDSTIVNVKNPEQNNGGNYFLDISGNNDQFNSKQPSFEEKSYTKKQVEEVRGFGKVMTKRELMESWGVAGNGTIDDVYEIINNKKSEYQNKFQKAIGSLTQVEEEIKNAINDIKSNLEDLGINVTGMEVECNDDDFEILVKTDWVLKGDDYDENEEDYRKYKYLADVKGAEYSYYRTQQGYRNSNGNQYSYVHFGLEDDKNPYFKIWGDIPDMNVEDNERY